jgi:hypothetical protein
VDFNDKGMLQADDGTVASVFSVVTRHLLSANVISEEENNFLTERYHQRDPSVGAALEAYDRTEDLDDLADTLLVLATAGRQDFNQYDSDEDDYDIA